MGRIEILDKISREASINVSEALSKMTKKEIGVEFCNTMIKKEIVPFPFIGDNEKVAGVFLSINGDISGNTLIVFPSKSALVMCDILQEKQIGTTKELNKMDEDALKEAGNVITGCFLSVLANRLKNRLIESIPSYIFGAFKEVLNTFQKGLTQDREVLVIEIIFAIEPIVIKVYLLILFEKETMSSLLNSASLPKAY